ncbi:MAG: phosphoribosylglycinamide formyltransferase [Bacteroidales bacterium]|jgi:phosphoribosylglycinamide formyltransferase-1
MSNIAIFASGSGSNAENIIRHFFGNKKANVKLILTNNPDAYVIERAKNLNINCLIFNREDLYVTDKIFNVLISNKIDFIVLAGFIWLVPDNIIKAYERRIVNIHPALLPAYGGKGMYGDRVHKAVIDNQEKESGITIHFVNQHYDEGDIIFQAKCTVEKGDSPKSLAKKVHALEYKYFPTVIENILEGSQFSD